MGNIIRFPLTLRAPDRRAREDTSDVLIFPFRARRHLIVRHARALRGASTAEFEIYLTKILEQLCDEIRALGIDCEACEGDAITEFAEAIGQQLHGPHYRLQLDEVAQ